MTSRARRPALRRRQAYNAVPLGRYSILLLVLGSFVYLVFMLGKMNFQVVDKRWTLTADFTDAGGLSRKDRPTVVINGVLAGRLTNIRYDGKKAVATLKLNKETKGLVHSDATIKLEPRSGLQDLAVNINPGSPAAPAMSDGGTIHQADARSYVGIDEVTDVLDADTRAYVQVVLAELDQGLNGKGAPALRAALRKLPSTLNRADDVTSILAERHHLLAQLVSETNVIFQTLGARGAQLRDVTQFGTQTVRVAAANESQIAKAVQSLPATLAATRSGLRAVRELAVPLKPALDQLRPAVASLEPAAKQLENFIPAGFTLTDALSRFVKQAPGGTRSLRQVADQLKPAAQSIEQGSARAPAAVDVFTDLFKPGNKVGDLLANVSGVFSTNDALGAVTRGGVAAYEPPTAENFGVPANADASDRKAMGADVQLALNITCLVINKVACDQRAGLAAALKGEKP